MPRPPAKRGRPPHQNALSSTAGVTKKKDIAQTAKTTTSTASRNTREKEGQDGPSIDTIIPATPSQVRHAGVALRGSTKVKRNQATPLTRCMPSSEVTPLQTGRAAHRGRFSAGPKAIDTGSLIQKLGTPGFESSMLSAFRPRPRQGSILQLMADDGSSDFDNDEDFLGSFEPEDESTPLNAGKRQTLMRGDLRTGDILVDAVDTTDEGRIPESPTRALPNRETTLSSPRNSDKRNLFGVPVLESREALASDRVYGSDNDGNTENGMSEDEDNLPPPMRRHSPKLSLEAWSQTLAPPKSSSPIASPAISPVKLVQPAKVRKTKKTDAEQRLHVSTATLQTDLMPQRRRGRRLNGRGEFDVFDEDASRSPSPEMRPDEDELSYLPARIGRNTSKKKLKENKTAVNTNRKGTQKRAGNARSAKVASKAHSGDRSGKARVTYSRRNVTDEENDEVEVTDAGGFGDASTVDDKEPFVSEELRLQAKKFAEVDQWSIDFEDVVVEQSSSYR
ncbi:hypothetical protein LOZ12_001112 [Ophidiomyces ophidiicola]|uniref:Uncharacterized protein n=1 Tax=Ophidiomyces ophidiicola TaxID=1387563 RepID=A0ACB8V5F7_9EURO|nr:uncharacterized protein LOZ57_006384 [Ophidiomyces ophidiicola]KAI1921085.1 hypothetical protein LOZ64_001711 [Ophidiomyces ophidiicola]KAI1938315.1 hypothetical protein LOZ57_006384 [Ophidiomyces ophidiicola]KAI1954461.1 hypothetical protein LOZ62_000755 [Ophidiomyces ophidiicola]KAI1961849.1 hypothetical protein LOZ59_002288 [Ophidiomyces ophidiicola]KAI1974447.1 hypothetical protein LOZ56_001190 [Ophidiomyces ophidiicola]